MNFTRRMFPSLFQITWSALPTLAVHPKQPIIRHRNHRSSFVLENGFTDVFYVRLPHLYTTSSAKAVIVVVAVVVVVVIVYVGVRFYVHLIAPAYGERRTKVHT